MTKPDKIHVLFEQGMFLGVFREGAAAERTKEARESAGKGPIAHQVYRKSHQEGSEAEALEQARAEIEALRGVLRFYANGQHMGFSREARFLWEDVSGEPPNWLQRSNSEHYEMIENGTIARSVLRGQKIEWEEGEQPPPIKGEEKYRSVSNKNR